MDFRFWVHMSSSLIAGQEYYISLWDWEWDWCFNGRRPRDGWSAQNQQTLLIKDTELKYGCGIITAVSSFLQSPRTESLYLFFTQALGIQPWGDLFAVQNPLF